MISRTGTPSHTLSSFGQRVTQCTSDVMLTRGSAQSSSNVQLTSSSTSPKQRNLHRFGSNRGVRPYVRTGHLLVRVWPGGTRAASVGSGAFIRRDLQRSKISRAMNSAHYTPAGMWVRAPAGRYNGWDRSTERGALARKERADGWRT